MHIVHLIQSATQLYGAERCVLLEAQALRQRGHSVHALLVHETRMGEQAGRLEAELQLLGVPTSRVLSTRQVSLQLLTGLAQALRTLRPDVVHSHSMKTDVLAAPLCRLLRLPLCIEVHGYLHPDDDPRVRLYERLDQVALRLADAAIVLSRDYHAEVRGYGVPAARVHLCPSGINVSGLRAQIGQRSVRAELSLPPPGQGPLVLGMVARLSAEKGHSHFLHSLRALRQQGQDVVGVLFGEGPLREVLQQEVQTLGLTEFVRFAGYIPQVADAYASLDVLVSCSRFEGLPLNLIEAMALGIPVVAMATGGCTDILADGECGRLVQRGDGNALTAALLQVCQDAPLRARMAVAGARRADAHFSLPAWASRIEQVYAAAISRRRPRQAGAGK